MCWMTNFLSEPSTNPAHSRPVAVYLSFSLYSLSAAKVSAYLKVTSKHPHKDLILSVSCLFCADADSIEQIRIVLNRNPLIIADFTFCKITGRWAPAVYSKRKLSY